MPPLKIVNVPQVLVIEDDPRAQTLYASALHGMDLAIVFARDGHEALLHVRHRRTDLVLLDLGLPDVDGYALMDQLKALPLFDQGRVLVVTGQSGSAALVRGFEKGIVDYLRKPFELEELRARVKAALRAKQLQDDLKLANLALEAAKASAETSARAKSDFLANMSHEIRTPMNGVLSMAELLLASELSAEQRELAQIIRQSGESLLTLLNDILDLSKIEAGKLELEEAPFSLRHSLEEVLDLLAARAAEKRIELVGEIEPHLIDNQTGDSARLRQVLLNLVGNAIKFTSQGEVSVRMELRSGQDTGGGAGSIPEIHTSIRDTGIGIPSAKMDRLFLPFSQADASTTRQFGGTGLGLAISRRLVELMGGMLWVESTMGEGSTFHFTLPSRPERPNETSHFATLPRLKGYRLLLVEDHSSCRRAISSCAQSWGMDVTEAASAREALALLHDQCSFDIALIDQSLPGSSGIELATQFRKLPHAAALPRVLLTTILEGPELLQEVPGLFAATVTKPVKPSLLNSALIRAVERAPVDTAKTKGRAILDPGLATRYPLRLLLAEDNAINQRVAQRILEKMGYSLTLASNGLEAVTLAASDPFDLIFMDVQMPELDGLQAAIRIRKSLGQPLVLRYADVRRPVIVAMTANAMSGDRERCLDAGMDDYLSKPIRSETLQSMIQTWAVKLRGSLAIRGTALSGSDSIPGPQEFGGRGFSTPFTA